MTLSEIANIVEILSLLTIVFGIFFGIAQIKLSRNQRRDLAILECAHSFEDLDFTEGYRLMPALSPGQHVKDIERLGLDYESAALRVGMKFETIGLLVFKGVVPIDAMSDLVGGAAQTIWKVLEPWVIENRQARSHQTFLACYQWLVDRLEELGQVRALPVYEVHGDRGKLSSDRLPYTARD